MNLSRRIKSLIIFLDVLIAVLSLIYFYNQQIYFIGSDSYYYLSLANSLVTSGKVRDLTTFPPGKPITPQNGIVYVMSALKLLGLKDWQVLKTVPLINFVMFIFAFYALAKTSRLLKFDSDKIYILSLFYFCHWVLYRLQLIPVNDGIFNALSIWAIYFVIVLSQKLGRKTYFRLLMISIIAVQFRITSYLILLSSVLSFIFLKERKKAILMFILLVITYLTFKQVYSLSIYDYENSSVAPITSSFEPDFELSPIQEDPGKVTDIDVYPIYYARKTAQKISDYYPFVADLKQLAETIPELFLARMDTFSYYLNFAFLIFLTIPLFGLYHGLNRKQFPEIYLSLVILSSICFIIFVGIIDKRYLFLVYIYTLLLLIKWMEYFRWLKVFIFGYLLMVILYSLYNFRRPYTKSCNLELMLSVAENGIKLPPNSILIAEEKRHAYLFLGKSKYDFELFSDSLIFKDIYISGSPVWIDNTLSQLNKYFPRSISNPPLVSESIGSDQCFLVKTEHK